MAFGGVFHSVFRPVFDPGGAVAGNGLRTNLLAYWSLTEPSGNRIDSSGNNHTMLAASTPGNRAGIIGNAVDVDVVSGTGKYLYYDDLTNNLACPAGSSISVACWFFLDTLTTAPSFMLCRWGPTGDWALVVDPSGYAAMVVESGASDISANTPTGLIATGTWYHVIGWYDHTAGANGTVYVQVNGGTVYSATLTTAKGNGARYVAIGDLGHTGVVFGRMDGAVDEAAIWRGVLTAAQRTALYNAGAGLDYSAFTT